MTTTPYTSPIPVRRAHLGDAIASEWTKMRSLRSTVWTLGAMVALVAGLGALLAVLLGESPSAPPESGVSVLSLGLLGMLLATVCVITLGVLTITSEFGTGMIRTTLTACPSRSRVLTAKAVVFSGLVFVTTSLVSALTAAAQVAIVGTSGGATGGQWARVTVGVGLFMACLGLLSLAVGALLRHSAGSITTMIGLVLLPYVLAIGLYTDELSGLRTALIEYSIPSLLGALYIGGGMSMPSGWEALGIIAGVTAVALGGAYAALDRRDA
ncbi:ABC transporter permease [Streptomyces somaliensis]|uniref:ABC transporter permease n=1 Tax=Streptomyces somaliensis TaxID=78355 RepID=UPI0020CC59FD|nr:ABC transporter permease [Streptomyces somaliensis]MCP9944546.1 ABC transporter permease [Streptomyces somaliensis]MCP9962227.1 ABC transporter permease [Streptomyces somaliensis]MCP9975047.1 ABC transporter permease [Streptomyces somaliensis]